MIQWIDCVTLCTVPIDRFDAIEQICNTECYDSYFPRNYGATAVIVSVEFRPSKPRGGGFHPIEQKVSNKKHHHQVFVSFR